MDGQILCIGQKQKTKTTTKEKKQKQTSRKTASHHLGVKVFVAK
ncbi:hypothetical protein DOY81_002200 [Sarcophaga bullata]|nr:hypothetical protein DOY81_002200 [Sarcophaga bullata]